MKIVAVDTVLVSYPPPQALTSSSATIEKIDCALVTVNTDEGIDGFGYVYILGGNPITPMKAVLDYLATVVVGMDPLEIGKVWEAMWNATLFIGPRGVPCFGISAIDVALWDIKGKVEGLPIHAMLGAAMNQVPTYYSGLFLNASIDELVEETKQKVEEGWWALKMRLGAKLTVEENEERVRAVREAAGSRAVLMADVSRQWDVPTAIKAGRMLERYNFAWFEDPVSPDDPNGHAEVAAALDIPVATGELAYSRHDFRLMQEKRVADIWMPDLERVGGITEWMRVGAMSQAAGIPISSHVFQEISIHVLAALPNTMFLEYLPLWEPLFVEPLNIEEGYANLPEGPGLGLTLNLDFIADHMVG